MCPFVIVVIMIALILFMPAVYAMGIARGITHERRHECAESAEGGKTLPSSQPQTKCTKCAKMRICMDPPMGMEVFCK